MASISKELRKTLVSEFGFGDRMVSLAIRSRFKCTYCDRDLLRSSDDYWYVWQEDHVIPQDADGPTEIGNLALSCIQCNQFKGKFNPAEQADPGAGLEQLIGIARRHVQAIRAEKQHELATVRRLIQAEIDL